MIVVDILAALIIAVLSGMGVGSGGLLVLYLTLVRDTPHLTAQGLNLLFFIFASGASLCIHLTRRQIALLPVALLTVGGLLGSLLGTRLSAALPEVWVARCFGLFLIGAGLLTLLRDRGKVKRTGNTSAV
jgi:uncharacterized membrane protein YfcA